MEKKGKLLIVDDNKDVLSALEVLLDDEFKELISLSNPNQILYILKQNQPDVVLLDMNFNTRINTGNEGLFWLKQIKEINPDTVVIMFTAFGDVHLAVKAMKEGATDFVLKPWDNEKLLATLKSALKLSLTQKESQRLKIQNKLLEREIEQTRLPILGNSSMFKKIIKTLDKVAPTDASILLTGENGTGKSVLAREIHNRSDRRKGPFVVVDLGSISESLFESELFGYKKGAFTDAKSDKAGRMIAANHGTLFLDEIGNLSTALQMKLLTVLQERKITPLGSNITVDIDVRLITATNRPLEELLDKHKFREDLLYRINTITIELPPLRERKEDIKLLAENFLQRFKNKYKKNEISMPDHFLNALQEHQWPGNIRELQHCIERCVILSQHAVLDPTDLEFSTSRKQENLSGSLEEIEKQAILNAIKKHQGNMIRAARELNITRQTIYNKMKKYGL